MIRSTSTVDDLTDSGTNQKGSKVRVNLIPVEAGEGHHRRLVAVTVLVDHVVASHHQHQVQLVSMQSARLLYDNRSGRTRKRWQRVRTLFTIFKINQCSNGKCYGSNWEDLATQVSHF